MTELFVHCCDACTAKKGPTGCSHAPLQQYQVGATMERDSVDILGPFLTTDNANCYVLVAMALSKQSESIVRILGTKSSTFSVGVGLCQGCRLSLILFVKAQLR